MRRRCPKCGGEMRDLGRERTVHGGVWYELRCPRCNHTADEFKPRREKRK